jgi:26S proteasome regulatory subunit T2
MHAVQRTMLELLNQLDGFDSRADVKVILATNKIESLDPALLRPGRVDRKILFPLPDVKTKRRIFGLHTERMTLGIDVDLEEFIMSKDELSVRALYIVMLMVLVAWHLTADRCTAGMVPGG